MRALFALFFLAAAVFAAPGAQAAPQHSAFTTLLDRYVVEAPDGSTRVRYQAWAGAKADRAALDAYVKELEGRKPSRMSRNEAFAYWANLYNAVTLQVILENYPVRSIRNIRSTGAGLDPKALVGPWRTKRVTVEGKRMSLDDIEHVTMRPTFKDPRVHYAVNCASIGCPDIFKKAWEADTLEAELDKAARVYVNHPRGATVGSDGRIRISSIYEWFKEDFGGNDAGVLAHLRKYGDADLVRAIDGGARIGPHVYDWALNDGR